MTKRLNQAFQKSEKNLRNAAKRLNEAQERVEAESPEAIDQLREEWRKCNNACILAEEAIHTAKWEAWERQRREDYKLKTASETESS